jgi:hypothetical protein
MPGSNRRLNSLIDCRRFNQWVINKVVSEEMSAELGSKLGSLVNTQTKIIIAINAEKEDGLMALEERLESLETD